MTRHAAAQSALSNSDLTTTGLGRAHWQRLRRMYRSAGWPCEDNIELDLLAAGLLERVTAGSRPVHLRLTDPGIEALSRWLDGNRRRRDPHEDLVLQTAEWLSQQGRICFCGLALRARPSERWLGLRPDIFSLRRTTRPAYLEPAVYEIKVKRSDLLADLNRPDKRGGYLLTASRCYYVLGEGVGGCADIPDDCGVIVASPSGLSVVRPAPVEPRDLPFSTWMALAQAHPYQPLGSPVAELSPV